MDTHPHPLDIQMRIFIWLGILCLAGCIGQTPYINEDGEEVPLVSVGYVDLDRYMGRWYMMANIPYFAERGNLAPHVDYSLRPDGLIADRFEARASFDKPPFVKNGLIEILNPMTNAEGRVTFLQPIWQDFTILYLDKDYRYTVIGHSSRNYCWIFAREPQLDEATYTAMRKVLTKDRFDVSRVLRLPHRPEEMGLPGYQ